VPENHPRIKAHLVEYDSRLELRDVDSIDMIVIHCTELPTMEIAVEFGNRVLYPSGTGNSGHYYIDKKGAILQFVSDERVAHHVIGFNERSLGIELVNSGRYPQWFHSESQKLRDPYPPEQIAGLTALVGFLRRRHPGLKFIARHEDLDRTVIPAEDDSNRRIRRKVDPGPLFPWGCVLSRSGLADFAESRAG